MTITIERKKKIQSLQIIDNIYIYMCVCVCVITQQRNIRKRCVTIKRIIQILKLLKDKKMLNNHKIYFL